MKKERAWPQFTRNLLIMVGSRNRPQLRRPTWIIVLLSIVSVFLIAAYVYPPHSPSACSLFSSHGCGSGAFDLPPAAHTRELTDAEVESRVVINEILNNYYMHTKKPKVAFLFLSPGSLPFEKLWHMFFQNSRPNEAFALFRQLQESGLKPTNVTLLVALLLCALLGSLNLGMWIHEHVRKNGFIISVFRDMLTRDTHARSAAIVAYATHGHGFQAISMLEEMKEKVGWGKISMVEAERRLLAHALLDPDNQHFVLLSESCIPVRRFEFVYNYLLLTNVSFIDRYIEHMLPEVEKKDFRKGSQPNMEGNRNCYADEHYLPTFFTMLDPGGIANWSVTYVDWSEGKWHPRSFRARDITYQVMKNIARDDSSSTTHQRRGTPHQRTTHVSTPHQRTTHVSTPHHSHDQRTGTVAAAVAATAKYIDESPHFTSDAKRTVVITPCMLNGSKRSCYLFARKFFPETQDRLIQLYSNSTIF
ncbi:hypothetical protein JHK85_048747 [Glycine max]|nr:hypothetical protein JHK85_048747 [Glycine max]